MSKRELIVRELDQVPERDLDRLLAVLRSLKDARAAAAMPALAKDWPSPEEDAAWANL